MYSKRPEYTGKCQSCFALNYTSQIYVVVAVFAEVIFLVLYYPMYFFPFLIMKRTLESGTDVPEGK